MLERLELKHELGGSVREFLAGAKLGEVTEPNKISLVVESWGGGRSQSMNWADQ